MTESEDLGELFRRAAGGDQAARARIFSLEYRKLEQEARALRGWRRGHTLDTGALVHEVYFRLRALPRWKIDSIQHFERYVRLCMRRMLSDKYGRRRPKKQGAVAQNVVFDDDRQEYGGRASSVVEKLMLQEALRALQAQSTMAAEAAKIFALSNFEGRKLADIAEEVRRPVATVRIRKKYAEVWLQRELQLPVRRRRVR